MTAHHCHAEGCTAAVPPRMLMCWRHWKMVPLPLKQAVQFSYRPGQEKDKRPSRDYIWAVRQAINAVRDQEAPKVSP